KKRITKGRIDWFGPGWIPGWTRCDAIPALKTSCAAWACHRKLDLFFQVGARAMKFEGRRAESLEDIFVHAQALPVLGFEQRQHVQSNVERCFWFVGAVCDDLVGLHVISVNG